MLKVKLNYEYPEDKTPSIFSLLWLWCLDQYVVLNHLYTWI